jgi:hypothetical protein
LSLLLAKSSEVAVANQPAALFIPKTETERFQAAEQRDGPHALKQPIGFMAPLQVIVGNPRAQMMEVMKPNVAREPLQDPG